jgi:hypothetical protein
MSDGSHFRFDLAVPGGGAAALARFGTQRLSGLSGFETVTAQRGYVSGRRLTVAFGTPVRVGDVSN